MSSQLGALLRAIGREDGETVSVCTQVPGQGGILNVHWTTVEAADALVDSLVGTNVWYGVQPLQRPERGRGAASDVTGVCALYADLDWKRPGKPNGMTPEEALLFVDKLSDILGEKPVGIVRSGNGIQPIFAVQRVDVEFGRKLLAWWRHQVLSVATEMKVSVDSQVFDLARILRAPGPPNLKDVENPQETLFVRRPGHAISRVRLFALMEASPLPETQVYNGDYDRRGGDLSPRDSVRFFTPEQANRYIQEHIMPELRNTPEGGGFNAALNAAAFSIAAFVPAFMDEEEASGMLADECARRWGSANQQDWATIDSGMRGCSWEAHVTPEDLASNPFYDFYESSENLPLAPGRQIREVHYDPNDVLTDNGQDTEFIEMHGRQFERAVVHPKTVPTEACYLSDTFWDSRPVLRLIRDLAWSTQTCPEAVLMGTFVKLAGSVGPNMRVHGGIGSPQALNMMGLLIGPSGAGKSTSWSVATRYINIVNGFAAPQFTPASGQGIMAMYGSWKRATGGMPGYFERTNYTAIGFLDETDTMNSLREMRGNTLSSVLRSAAMGNTLGSQTMDADRRTRLEEGSYGFAMVACGQPLRMGWLLNQDEVAGGLPQRFLWAPAVALLHPVVASIPQEVNIGLPLEAQPMENVFEGAATPRRECVMMAPQEVCEYIAFRYRQRQMFGGDPMMAHVDLTRLKVAGYLALMDGRIVIAMEDWNLAGEVVRTSVNTSQWTWAQLEESLKAEAEQKARSRGRADAATAIVAEVKHVESAAAAVLRIVVANDGISAGQVSSKLSRIQKENRDAAIAHLEDQGLIRVEELESGGRKLWLP